ncbi:hypothetical protein V6N13_136045 [Hibiscus sabdariffa]
MSLVILLLFRCRIRGSVAISLVGGGSRIVVYLLNMPMFHLWSRQDSETVDHVLRKYSVAKRVWQGVIAPDKIQDFYALSFLVWFDKNIRCAVRYLMKILLGKLTLSRFRNSFRLLMQQPFLPLVLGRVLNEPLAIYGDPKVKRRVVAPESWLPPGWLIEDRVRSSGATAGLVDRYYFEPSSGRRFRSKKEVLYFLETGSPPPKRKKGSEGSSSEGLSTGNSPGNKKKKFSRGNTTSSCFLSAWFTWSVLGSPSLLGGLAYSVKRS